MSRRRIMMGQKKDANTLLLLHAEDFTDSSMYARPITNVGAEIVAGKFGNCFHLIQNQLSYVLLPETINSTSDFTVDFWVKFDHIYGFVVSIGTTSDAASVITEIYADAYGVLYFVSGLTTTYVSIPISGLTTNTWYHIAFVRNGSNFYAFINGSLAGTSNNPVAYDNESALYSVIGDSPADPGLTYHMFGSIDEFRISNIARWTASFTPPTAPYTI